MKPFLPLLLLLCLTGAYRAAGQQYRHAVGVSLGSFRLRTLDQQASPLRYAGTIQPLYGLSYRHLGEQSRFGLRLSGGQGTMNPDRFGARTYSTPFPDGKTFSYQVSSELYAIHLEADYLRRVSSAENTRTSTWVGGSLQENIWYASDVASFPWIVNTATLSPTVLVEHPLQPRHNLTLRVDLAVLGLITRAVYANFAKTTSQTNAEAYFRQGTRLAFPTRLANTTLQLGYGYRLSPRIHLGAVYRARYLSYPAPRPIRAVTSSLALESEVRF